MQLGECFRDASLSRHENHVKNFCQQIFASWQATIQLLGPLSSENSDLMILQQKNIRILRRVSLGLKEGFFKKKICLIAFLLFLTLHLGSFEKLTKALVDCANSIELKLMKRRQTTAEGEELLYDLLQHLENASN